MAQAKESPPNHSSANGETGDWEWLQQAVMELPPKVRYVLIELKNIGAGPLPDQAALRRVGQKLGFSPDLVEKLHFRAMEFLLKRQTEHRQRQNNARPAAAH